jgi:hypothetical protein
MKKEYTYYDELNGIKPGDIVKCVAEPKGEPFIRCGVGVYYEVGNVGKFGESGPEFLEINGYSFPIELFEKIFPIGTIAINDNAWLTFVNNVEELCPYVSVEDDGSIYIETESGLEKLKSRIEEEIRTSPFAEYYDLLGRRELC